VFSGCGDTHITYQTIFLNDNTEHSSGITVSFRFSRMAHHKTAPFLNKGLMSVKLAAMLRLGGLFTANLRDPGVDRRIILRCIFSKWDVMAWTGSSWLRIGTERSNEPLGSIKCREFLD
jgi:hypothetical protein